MELCSLHSMLSRTGISISLVAINARAYSTGQYYNRSCLELPGRSKRVSHADPPRLVRPCDDKVITGSVHRATMATITIGLMIITLRGMSNIR